MTEYIKKVGSIVVATAGTVGAAIVAGGAVTVGVGVVAVAAVGGGGFYLYKHGLFRGQAYHPPKGTPKKPEKAHISPSTTLPTPPNAAADWKTKKALIDNLEIIKLQVTYDNPISDYANELIKYINRSNISAIHGKCELKINALKTLIEYIKNTSSDGLTELCFLSTPNGKTARKALISNDPVLGIDIAFSSIRAERLHYHP